jgi:glutamine synthetase type III
LYSLGVSDAMLALRQAIDEMEEIVIDESWPLPKYREMLFIS